MEPKQARLVGALNKLLRTALKRGKVSFTWDSIQVNWNIVATPHADAGVQGCTAILLLGAFEGGTFQLQIGANLDRPGRILIFPAHLEHFSEPFTGERYSIVFFSRGQGTDREGREHYLASLGFQLSAPPDNQAVLRVLYCFSGPHRRASLGTALAKVAASRQGAVFVEIREVDILNGDDEDLTNDELANDLLTSIKEGDHEFVVIAPPATPTAAPPTRTPWGPGHCARERTRRDSLGSRRPTKPRCRWRAAWWPSPSRPCWQSRLLGRRAGGFTL
jgi:hypothetical protein